MINRHILLYAFSALFLVQSVYAQENNDKQSQKQLKIEKRNRINLMIRNEEEGVPAYAKHNLLTINSFNDGLGLAFEKGFMKTPYIATIFQLELSEKKHVKEIKSREDILYQTPYGPFYAQGPSFIYGKQNSFYQVRLSYGQQRMLGGKSNKNGVAVFGIFTGGIVGGLMRPNYLLIDGLRLSFKQKFTEETRSTFLDASRIKGGTGLRYGWNEMQFNPGLNAKAALRFDWGRFNQVVSALDVGFSFDIYTKKAVQMVDIEGKRFFPTGYIALVFGNRK